MSDVNQIVQEVVFPQEHQSDQVRHFVAGDNILTQCDLTIALAPHAIPHTPSEEEAAAFPVCSRCLQPGKLAQYARTGSAEWRRDYPTRVGSPAPPQSAFIAPDTSHHDPATCLSCETRRRHAGEHKERRSKAKARR